MIDMHPISKLFRNGLDTIETHCKNAHVFQVTVFGWNLCQQIVGYVEFLQRGTVAQFHRKSCDLVVTNVEVHKLFELSKLGRELLQRIERDVKELKTCNVSNLSRDG